MNRHRQPEVIKQEQLLLDNQPVPHHVHDSVPRFGQIETMSPKVKASDGFKLCNEFYTSKTSLQTKTHPFTKVASGTTLEGEKSDVSP